MTCYLDDRIHLLAHSRLNLLTAILTYIRAASRDVKLPDVCGVLQHSRPRPAAGSLRL